MSEKGICDSCKHRADSIENVKKWRERGGEGMVCDPAPKVECKDHEGYGRYATKISCRDFIIQEEGGRV